MRGKNILVGISGGIAVYKVCDLVRSLTKQKANVRVIMTKNATKFVGPVTFEALTNEKVFVSEFEGAFATQHIELARWADLLVVAPATANIIGKFANGIADDLLSTVYLAYNRPAVIGPAMNTQMLKHLSVQSNMYRLQYSNRLVPTRSGHLPCGEQGDGAMGMIDDIVMSIRQELIPKDKRLMRKKYPLEVLITAGATREFLDPVRFLSNPSSGKMGLILAKEAAARGAEVTLVHGPINEYIPNIIDSIPVVSVADMHREVMKNKYADVFISSAAVSDFTPSEYHENKQKKKDEMTVHFNKTTDILKDFSEKKSKNQITVGFAAETNFIIENAHRKMDEKNLDFIVANDVSESDAGFGSDMIRGKIIQNRNHPFFTNTEFELISKEDMASKLFDFIERLSSGN